MLKKIISICFIVFGSIGLLVEAGSYSKNGTPDIFGFVLAGIFIGLGILLSFGKKIKLRAKSPSSRTFLLISGMIELAAGIPLMAFIFIFGLHGFYAGETGTMIGLLSMASLIFVVPYILLKAAAVYGLIKRKKWSIYFSFVFGIIYFFAGISFIAGIPIIAVLLLLYAVLTRLTAIKCLKTKSLAASDKG